MIQNESLDQVLMKLTAKQYQVLKLLDKYKHYLLSETIINGNISYSISDINFTNYNNEIINSCEISEIQDLIQKKILRESNITTGANNTKYYKMVEFSATSFNVFKIVTAGIKLN